MKTQSKQLNPSQCAQHRQIFVTRSYRS